MTEEPILYTPRPERGDGPPNPMALIETAVSSGASIETLERLMALQERWEANQAKRAFDEAMAAFKADPPDIFKNRQVAYSTSKGATKYDHASLDHIATQLAAKMAPLGLSWRWRTEQNDGRGIRVTCILAHKAGHSEEVSLETGPDDSGGKNKIQAIGSTVTYLQRYTLLAITGSATQDQDDDGVAAAPIELVTEQQAASLTDLITEVGADEKLFCRYMEKLTKVAIERVEDIPAVSFKDAVAGLEAKRATK